MTRAWDRIVTGVLVTAIVVATSVLVHREIFNPRAAPVMAAPQYVNNWQRLLTTARIVGDSTAPVSVVVFEDVECPACRAYQHELDSVAAVFGDDVSIAYVYMPLPFHIHAYAAAKAAECANQQGRFSSFLHAALERQDSLGLRSWSAYGRDAGIQDSEAFAVCANNPNKVAIVEAGIAAGKRYDVHATPTVLVDGWRYPEAPGFRVLSKRVDEILRSTRPQATQGTRMPAPEVTVVAGVRQFTYSTIALDRARQLLLEQLPLAVVGGPGASPSFDLSNANTVALLADGNVAALSTVDSRLDLFGADGKPIRRIGRRGEGPGEFRGVPDMVRVAGDTLLLPDLGNMRMDWVTANHGVVKADPVADRVGAYLTNIAGALPEGRIVLYSFGRLQQGVIGKLIRQRAQLAVLGPDGPARIVASIPDVVVTDVPTHYEGKPGFETVAVGFSPEAKVVVWDTLIATSTNDQYRIDLRNGDGAIISTLAMPQPRRPVTRAMHDANVAYWLAQLHTYREHPRDMAESERLIRQAPYADSLPAYAALFVSPDATLWAVDAIAPGDTAWSATAFHPNGAIVGRLFASTRNRPVAFGDSDVVVRAVDADGVVSLEVHKFKTVTRE